MPEEIAKLNSPRLKTSKAVLEVFARASQHDQLTGREIISKLSEILGIEDIHSLRGRINPILDRFVDSGLIVKEELAAPRDSSRFGYRISAKGRAQLEAGQIPRRKALLSTPSERAASSGARWAPVCWTGFRGQPARRGRGAITEGCIEKWISRGSFRRKRGESFLHRSWSTVRISHHERNGDGESYRCIGASTRCRHSHVR
ncbi:helix-turn-helix transcriptional regulator [Candidatus Kaiserbacteria bacterium]|nr:helix-turn-helix transcriptional regulator [Candidatus Kaiserbacteria bacterium]